MRRIRRLSLFVSLVLLAHLARAQNPTAIVTGTAKDANGQPLPGVTVTARSPALQGTRTTATNTNGDYLIPQLPPGDYTVEFELQGFLKTTQEVRLSAAQTVKSNAVLQIQLTAEMTVSAQKETISQVQQAAVTYGKDTIEKLPVGRNFQAAVTLAPGVNNSGPAQNIVISGAMSYENLFLINGVVVNENVRGQPLNLFIEDAVQETTTAVAGISAEYGRFGGGVINVITKSGGNSFSGSFRTSFTNDSWQSKTKYVNPATGQNPENLVDKTVPIYEATLGGPVLKDHIWFFGAGRSTNSELNANTASPVNASYVTGVDQQRFEGKLTFNLGEKHTVKGNYQKINQTDKGNSFGTIYDLNSVYDRETPQQIYSVNYTGTLTNNFFLEGQYSRRQFTFKNSGSAYTDLIKGTLLIDNSNAFRYWSPTFCGVCDDEKRDNSDVLVKASYFLSTPGLGSHTIVVGYDRFNDERFANNHQSGSDYRIIGTGVIVRDGVVYPRWTTAATGNSPTYIQWNPIIQSSEGTNFITHSVFLNDSWSVFPRLTISAGLRWDKNQGDDAGGARVVDDSKLSPRVGATYDVFGNGDTIVTGFYARYVAGIANNQADAASIGGQPAQIQFDYRGPQINPDVNAPTSSLVTSDKALQTLFDWFQANGGTSRAFRGTPTIPGVNPNIDKSLASPHTDELSLGVAKRLGPNGVVRVDGIHRRGHDFYATRVDTGTGTVTGTIPGTSISRTLDKQLVVNTEAVERRYWGLNLNFSYRVLTPLRLEGNWTWSHAYGNFDGETGPNGPIRSGVTFYPEYFDRSWSYPVGDLAIDRRHKVRLWAIYDIHVPWRWLGLSASVLHSYDSGAPYGAIGTVDTRPFVKNPGYLSPPASVNYYFSAPDAFRTDNVQHTDVALDFSFKPGFRDVELFLQPQVINVFNRQSIADPNRINTGIRTRNSAGTAYAAFNPFTETPVEGTHWEKSFQTINGEKVYTFGQPTGPLAYQQPRVVRFSVGIRF
jgi:outer membrane receptor for ferrienterochelin and colicin